MSLGGNLGGGLTVRLGQSPLKFYSEVRYHYAPHDGVATSVVPVTLACAGRELPGSLCLSTSRENVSKMFGVGDGI